MCQSLSSFFRKRKQKLVLWFERLLSRWNVKDRYSHRNGLRGGISILRFLWTWVLSCRHHNTQAPSLHTCQRRNKRDLIIIRAVEELISESEKHNYSSGSALRRKERKVKTKITKWLPADRLYHACALVPNWTTSSWQRYTEGKRKSIRFLKIKRKGSSTIDTIQGKGCIYTSTLRLPESEQQNEAHWILQQRLWGWTKNYILSQKRRLNPRPNHTEGRQTPAWTWLLNTQRTKTTTP